MRVASRSSGGAHRRAPARGRRCGGAAVAVAAVVLFVVVGSGAAADAARRRPAGPRVYEKDVNLDEALRLAAYLRDRGVTVITTRDHDVFVPLPERARIADAAHADLFVSIHNNGSRSRNQRGTEIYHQYGNFQGEALARRLLDALTQRTGFPRGGVFTRLGSHGDYYFVHRRIETLSILVEGGYVSNPVEAAALADPSVRQQMAEAIGESILAELMPAPPEGPGPPAPVAGPLGLPLTPTALSYVAGVPGLGTLSWNGASGIGVVHTVWRDGYVLGQAPARGAVPGATERVTFEVPVRLEPGTHRFQVQTSLSLAGLPLALSAPVPLDVVHPLKVVVDAGHGGHDPGAVGPR